MFLALSSLGSLKACKSESETLLRVNGQNASESHLGEETVTRRSSLKAIFARRWITSVIFLALALETLLVT